MAQLLSQLKSALAAATLVCQGAPTESCHMEDLTKISGINQVWEQPLDLIHYFSPKRVVLLRHLNVVHLRFVPERSSGHLKSVQVQSLFNVVFYFTFPR